MDRRTFLFSAAALIAQNVGQTRAQTATGNRGIMLLNRIGPSTSELYVANADGSGERKFLQNSIFEYHASYSPDGKWVIFTSERNGLGQSDVFRARPDGTDIQSLITGPAVDDAAVMSPNGSRAAFVSTRDGYRANIWTLDLNTKNLLNLTGGADVQGDPSGPDGFFRPSWSPDSQWLAFSSDRN